MSLLPRSHTEFQSKTYWEKFFQKRTKSFEWYGEYLDLCHVLHKYIKHQNRVLVVGCGNSKLSEDLYDVGCTDLENIDISDTVVKQMTAKNQSKRPKMNFTVMDVTGLTYADSSFDCVLDKGTLDALFTDESHETVSKVRKMFSEITRVLKSGGRYICVSLLQEHILNELMEYFSQGWIVRVHKVEQKPKDNASWGDSLPVFVMVFAKMASCSGVTPIKIYEYFTDGDHSVRCDVSGIVDFVKNCLQYALVRHGMSNINLEDQVKLELWSEQNVTEPRYTLRIVDQPKKKAVNGQFAIFLVPQGREINWLFSTDDGCKQLAENAGFERLVVVSLHRGHTYKDIDAVKDEVTPRAVELKQEGLPDGKKCPVLTLGDHIGTRKVLYEGSSAISGDFVVEEVESDNGEWIRRLVYLSCPHLAQTEVLLKPVLSSKQKPSTKSKSQQAKSGFHYSSKPVKLAIDHATLLMGFHQSMIGSLAFVDGIRWRAAGGSSIETPVRVLTVGLGGGALQMYMDTCLSGQIFQDVVELDHKILETASLWFGLKHNKDIQGATTSDVTVYIDNGIDFIVKAAINGPQYNAIVLDVDSKDQSSGMSSPPATFITEHFLSAVKSCLRKGGILVSNVCARNKTLEIETILSISKIFEVVLVIETFESINKVIIALPETRKDVSESVDGTDPTIITAGDIVLRTVKFRLSKSLKQRIIRFCSAFDPVHTEDIKRAMFDVFEQCYLVLRT